MLPAAGFPGRITFGYGCDEHFRSYPLSRRGLPSFIRLRPKEYGEVKVPAFKILAWFLVGAVRPQLRCPSLRWSKDTLCFLAFEAESGIDTYTRSSSFAKVSG